MKNPSRLLVKLSKNLFSDPSEQESFIAALTDPNPPPPHIVWLKPRPQTRSRKPEAGSQKLEDRKNLASSLQSLASQVVTGPWSALFHVDVLPADAQPGKEDLHEKGCYYCMDSSSIAALSVIGGISFPITTLLDLCSAPGGKGILAWHRFKPSLSVFNEVSRKRISPLIYNLKRCLPKSPSPLPSPLKGEGTVSQILVTQMDPQKLSEKIPSSASLVLVDAPCSGQSLLARGESAPGCFHPVLIKRCSGRQRRILACAGKLVAPGGYLVYMTCTFSREENEEVVGWFLEKNTAFTPVSVPLLSPFQSHLSEIPCYRFWPHRGVASGSFAVLLKKTDEGTREEIDAENLRTVWRSGQ